MIENKKLYTFDQLYKQYKKNGRGLNPNPKKRGEENPIIKFRALDIIMGKVRTKGFKLIECVLAHPNSLNKSFSKVSNVDISHWVRRYV